VGPGRITGGNTLAEGQCENKVHPGIRRLTCNPELSQLGRPKIAEGLEKRIQTQLRTGKGILKVAREFGVGTGTVQRIKDEMSGPFDAAAAA